jgi:molecular chaperone DnaK
MVQAAEDNRAADEERKKGVELRNNADSLAHQTEQTIEEMSEQLSDSDKETLKAGVQEVRDALAQDDDDAIEQSVKSLQTSSNEIFNKMYQDASAAPGSAAGADSKRPDDDDDVIDAEFEEA